MTETFEIRRIRGVAEANGMGTVKRNSHNFLKGE